jgi:hypothetical protein
VKRQTARVMFPKESNALLCGRIVKHNQKLLLRNDKLKILTAYFLPNKLGIHARQV